MNVSPLRNSAEIALFTMKMVERKYKSNGNQLFQIIWKNRSVYCLEQGLAICVSSCELFSHKDWTDGLVSLETRSFVQDGAMIRFLLIAEVACGTLWYKVKMQGFVSCEILSQEDLSFD